MANERLYQFPSKASPVPADIVYVGNSANAFNEVQCTIAEIISAYSTLAGLAGIALGANTYPYVNNANVYTAGTITAMGINVLALGNAADSILATDGSALPLLTQTLPTAVQANITQLGIQSQALDMGAFRITNLDDPVNPQDAATKSYVLSISSGFMPIPGCQAATTANLNATQAGAGIGATLTNAGAMAAFAVDGYSASVNDRILVKDQIISQHNGIYNVTTLGSGAVDWVLTRATDYDTAGEIVPGTFTSVINGTANGSSSFYETQTVSTVDTDPILFSVFFSPGTYIGSTSITTLGTITTGVWHGTTIGSIYGGTGLASFAKNSLIYASAANTWAELLTANSSLLGTDGSGNVGWTTTPDIGTPSAGVLTNCTGYKIANLSDVAWTSFSGSIGYTGFSGTPTTNFARYKIIGKTLFFQISMSGNSNAISFTITGMPATSAIGTNTGSPLYQALNNSTSVYTAQFSMNPSSTTLVMTLSNNATGWTASGLKGISFSGFYEIA